MRRGRQAQVVKLSSKERNALEALVRQSTAAQRDVVRAKVALMADEGLTTAAIAASLGLSLPSVSKWRSRVASQGMAGLRELQRPGRPRRIADAQRLQLLALACEPAEELGRATPTLDELCERAVQRGVVPQITCASAPRPSSHSATSRPSNSPAMPTPLAQASAAELQRHLAELTGHTAAQVRPYGKHLLIQMQRDDVRIPVNVTADSGNVTDIPANVTEGRCCAF